MVTEKDCEKFVESKYGTLYLKNGILFRVFNRKTTIDLEAAKQCLLDRKVLVADRKLPVIVDLTNVKSISRQARQFLSSSEFTTGILCWAFYSRSQVMKKIIYFFVTINKPKAPVRQFSELEDAIKYCNVVVEKNTDIESIIITDAQNLNSN